MAVQMQHAKNQEAADPLVDSFDGMSDMSSDSDNAQPTNEDTNEGHEEPKKQSQPALTKPKPSKKRKSGKKTKLDELMEQATKMMDEAGKASRTHRKYLKNMAADKGFDISSDSG
uniref:Uncharacterized protein LOC116304774 n=1 Tax=Actinia tenebrosa TaxID=6105 RepID=A0A6P8IU22_ACTTE